MADTLLTARPSSTTSGPELLHLTCCDDDIAMCGEDVSEAGWAEDGPQCPLCALVDEMGLPCPVTGCAQGRGAA